IGEDSTKWLSAARGNIGSFRRHNEFYCSKSDRHERHASGHAADRMVKKIALSTVGLVREAFLEDLLIFSSERGLLSSPPRLGLVVRRLPTSREATIGLKNGARRKPARPRAFPVRVLRDLGGLNRAGHHRHGDPCSSERAGQCSKPHDYPPASSGRLIDIFLNHMGAPEMAQHQKVYTPQIPPPS